MGEGLTGLRHRLAELADLSHASSLAHWDQQTMMPARGAEARAESLATLTRISHDMFIDPDTGRLVEAAAAELNGADPDSDEVRMVALARRQWEKGRRVTSELAAEMARAASIGQEAWVSARENSDFAAFAPYLEHNIELVKRYVDCHMESGLYERPYDVMLDDFEPQMPSAEVSRLFAELKAELLPLIERVAGLQDTVDAGLLSLPFAVDGQRALVREVLGWMGYEDSSWRMDDTVHPFATRIGTGDVRLTTRWDEQYFPMGLYGAMHECGHGLYEAGIPSAFRRTPIGSIVSLGMHESQSRLWENMVGRGRPLCEAVAPRVAALAGGDLAGLTGDRLFPAVNRVKPSLVRVEADEVTYSLHIILRFELEQALVDGDLKVADLPEAWNARVQEYLGLSVPSDALGVLQDVHWSGGLIGYFPTYALGNLIAGQLWERAHEEIPGLDEQIRQLRLGVLRDWLGQRVHRHGSKFTTNELLMRELGAPISVTPFVTYLKGKLEEVYGLDLTT